MNVRDDPRDIRARAALVREARRRALERGYVAPSPGELTEALGDELGLDSDARRRAARCARKTRAAVKPEAPRGR